MGAQKAGAGSKGSKAAKRRSNESEGFTAEEKAAMKERAKELRAAKKRSSDRAGGEADVLAKIAEMPEADRKMAKRLHELITKTAPDLMPRTWYGMPAYSSEDGKIVCFFQAASKFGARYATLGFNDRANLDEGSMWPTSFALEKLTRKDEARVRALVEKAVS